MQEFLVRSIFLSSIKRIFVCKRTNAVSIIIAVLFGSVHMYGGLTLILGSAFLVASTILFLINTNLFWLLVIIHFTVGFVGGLLNFVY